VIAPRDEEAIARYLAGELRAFVAGTRSGAPLRDEEGIRRYHRRALAGEFADAMRCARELAS
jgi:hypothetical protein